MSMPGQRRFRNVLLTGLPGVGKSTFGKAYAQMSRTEFVELDRYVERLAGQSISEIFAQDGEAVFRELEAKCLERLLKRQRCTIALGGGTLTHPESLQLAQALGCIVLLTAPIPLIVRRLWPEISSRPLLSDCKSEAELATRLETIWCQREASYLLADLTLETAYSSVDTLKIELAWLEAKLLSGPTAKKVGVDSASSANANDGESSFVLRRPIPLADADYRSPREPRGGREMGDKMERILKAQRQKDRSEKRDKRDKKSLGQRPPENQQSQSSAVGPQPRAEGPQPRAEGPQPRAEGQQPRAEGPQPRAEGQQPRAEGPQPRAEGPQPKQAVPKTGHAHPQGRGEGQNQRRQAPRQHQKSGQPSTEGPVPRSQSNSNGSALGRPVPRARDEEG